MDRREFIKGIAALTASAQITGCSFNLLGAGNPVEDDFVVLEKTDDAISLVEFITKGSSEIAHIDEVTEFDKLKTTVLPSFLISLGINDFHDYYYSGKSVKFPMGKCNLINSEGYFLTAFHVLKELAHEPRVVMLYDYQHDLIAVPKLLSYSKKYDVALGKIDVREDVKINPQYLVNAEIKPEHCVQGILSTTKVPVLNRIVNELFDSCTFEKKGNIYTVSQNKKPEIDFETMGFKGWINKVVAVEMQGKPYVKEGTFFIHTNMNLDGNSGMNLYSYNGDLLGVLNGDQECSSCKSGEYVIRCTSPDKIRILISNYVKKCTGRKSV